MANDNSFQRQINIKTSIMLDRNVYKYILINSYKNKALFLLNLIEGYLN